MKGGLRDQAQGYGRYGKDAQNRTWGSRAAALGKKVGISQAQVSRLENGQQGFRSGTLVKLARALKVPPFRLFMTEKEWRKWKRSKR